MNDILSLSHAVWDCKYPNSTHFGAQDRQDSYPEEVAIGLRQAVTSCRF